MKTTVKAVVKGEYQYPNMKAPKQFALDVAFTLYPPHKGDVYYGTGCYMSVDIKGQEAAYVDVRYEGTTDIEKLAERYIKNYWGNNLREYELSDFEE